MARDKDPFTIEKYPSNEKR